MNQKLKQQRFLKNLWLLHTKKVYIDSFIKARLRIRNGPRRPKPDLDPTKMVRYDRIRIHKTVVRNMEHKSNCITEHFLYTKNSVPTLAGANFFSS
jgi:hypothetical protein